MRAVPEDACLVVRLVTDGRRNTATLLVCQEKKNHQPANRLPRLIGAESSPLVPRGSEAKPKTSVSTVSFLSRPVKGSLYGILYTIVHTTP